MKKFFFKATIICSVIFLASCNTNEQDDKSEISLGTTNTTNQHYINMPTTESKAFGDNIPISRAAVAKMIALTFNDVSFVNSLDIEHNLADVDENSWYAAYVNAVYIMGVMRGNGRVFNPNEPLTLYAGAQIIDILDQNNVLDLGVTEENKNAPISYALWIQIYKTVLDNLSITDGLTEFGITSRNLVVLATQSNNANLSSGTLITDKGPFTSYGVDNAEFIDTKIEVLEKSGEILAITGVIDTSPLIRNGLVVDKTEDSITVFIGGVNRVFGQNNLLDANTSNNIIGTIADIRIHNGRASSIYPLSSVIVSPTIERVTGDFIEFYGLGRLQLSTEFKVYAIVDGKVRWMIPRNLIVGTNIANFILNGDLIEAAIITENAAFENIRVAIGTTGFSSMFHTEVQVTATEAFTIRGATGSASFSPMEIVSFNTAQDLMGGYRVYVETATTGRIKFMNINRGPNNDQIVTYRGTVEIALEENGFSIINQVPINYYLYAVVPSEMPSTYGVEPSKIQAITARSFAHNQFFHNRMHHIGANVDDSVMSQVYNNIPENQVSIQAVDQTANMYLTFGGEVIGANFFSTSAGITANQGDVWPGGHNTFPSSTRPFLQSVRHYHNDDFLDLSKEENARVFFNNTNVDAYCNISSWFRWNVTMTAEQVAASINANLENRFNANRFLIKTLQDDGFFRPKPVSTIGELVDIEVISRGEGGNITVLQIVGTQNTIRILTEFNIRILIAPFNRVEGANDIALHRNDGTIVTNFSMMPSSFFTIERLTDGDGNIISVRFIGGGFGHGVGLSQYGAIGKLNRGYSVVEVMEHFYTGAVVVTKE